MRCCLTTVLYLCLFATSMSALKLQQQCTAAIISSFTNAATNPAFLDRFSIVLGSKESKKLVYIPTASYAPDRLSLKSVGEQRRRARYDAKHKMELIRSTLSLKTSAMLELDTAGTTTQRIAAQLSDAAVLYVDGGNTFYLQRHMIETGFWDAALPAMEGGCLYIGASAGGIVAGKSIETAYWKEWDDPRAAGELYDWNDERLCGANLCAGESFFMHYVPEVHKELVQQKSAAWGEARPVVCVGEDECRWYAQEGNGIEVGRAGERVGVLAGGDLEITSVTT